MSQSTLSLLKTVSLSDSTRTVVDIVPLGNQTITNNNNLLQIVLPNMPDGIGVFPDASLNFDLNLGTTGSVVYDTRSIFKTFKILANGKEIINETEFGHRGSLSNLIEISDPSYRDNSYGQMLGSNYFTATSSTYTRRVCMKFPKHSFLDQLVPLFGPVRLEIQLYTNQNISEFVDAVTTESSYSLTNVSLRLPILHSKVLTDHFKSQPVRTAIDSYEHYRDMSISSGNTSSTIPVAVSKRNISGILMVFRNQADTTDADLGLAKYTGANMTNALSQFQLRVNGRLFPDKPINCDNYTELYEYLLEFARMKKGNSQLTPCSLTNSVYTAATDGSFLVAIPLSSLTGSASTVNGTDTTRGANQIQLISTMVASAATQTDIWIRYTQVVSWINGVPSLD